MATTGDHWTAFEGHIGTLSYYINEDILANLVMILLGKYYLANSVITKFARIYI